MVNLYMLIQERKAALKKKNGFWQVTLRICRLPCPFCNSPFCPLYSAAVLLK